VAAASVQSILAFVVAALALGACKGSSTGRAEPPKPVTHTVTAEAVQFTPQTIAIKAGDSVTWVNKDPFPHNVKTGSGPESPAIQAGASWTGTFSTPGDYPYTCTLHPTMKGVLQVR
jgi:plastocyanin